MSDDEHITFETGSIVKIKTELLFNEMTKSINAAPFVYGVLDFIEDDCDVTGSKAWHVNWALKHLTINSDGLQHIFPVLERDIELMKGPWELDGHLNRRWMTYHFFDKKENGEWTLREYAPLCEFCHFSNCDRMIFANELDLHTEVLLESDDMANNEKRK